MNILLNALIHKIYGQSCHLPEQGTLCIDHRLIKQGDIYVAMKGQVYHGNDFINGAIQNGAAAIILEEPTSLPLSVPSVILPELQKQWPIFIDQYYDSPSKQLYLTATTGTNGKSSIAYWLKQAFDKAQRPSAYLGTLGLSYPGHTLSPTKLTTPDTLTLQKSLKAMQQAGAISAHIEASSHGLAQNRLAQLDIDCAIFTQLTQDHLDYHHTMEAYFQTKRKLFEAPSLKHAVINIDCPYGQKLIAYCQKRNLNYTSYSLKNPKADYYLHAPYIHTPSGRIEVQRHIMAEFEYANLLAVIATCMQAGIDKHLLPNIINTLPSVPGRLNSMALKSGAIAVIDFAHTPDAFEKVLTALKKRARSLTVVFGLGGHRDQTKRPIMGEIAAQHANKIILTADNSRGENTEHIIEAILSGIKNKQAQVILDRKEAILTALKQSKQGEIILIAGKGHEQDLILNQDSLYFNENEIIAPFSDAI